MGNLNSAFAVASSALDALQYALNVSQNNIDNASTPGYAAQSANLVAAPFDPLSGLSGGVLEGPPQNSRDLLAENDVWQQSGAQGSATAQSQALTDLQNALPTGSGDGIPAALTTFFSAVSAWSASPNDSGTEQSVITAATSLAQSFNTTAAGVTNASQSLQQSIGTTVSQINSLTSQLANLNAQVLQGGQQDSGLTAQIYSSLENLSGLVNIQVMNEPDGTVQVTTNDGQPLVMETQQFALSAQLVDSSGNPVASGHSEALAHIHLPSRVWAVCCRVIGLSRLRLRRVGG